MATAGDATRYNTLIEGFCDFFTLNVRKAMTIDAPIAAQVEGPYADGNPPPPDNSGVYPSHAQAEQVQVPHFGGLLYVSEGRGNGSRLRCYCTWA